MSKIRGSGGISSSHYNTVRPHSSTDYRKPAPEAIAASYSNIVPAFYLIAVSILSIAVVGRTLASVRRGSAFRSSTAWG
ncbi:hypothetical protein [Acidocella sp.]|jgi:hypothetical protein|uniref:hypothetical protein n=1 Tax=Acidocella sp. TaxID=50710 RepID=UPI002F3ED7CC